MSMRKLTFVATNNQCRLVICRESRFEAFLLSELSNADKTALCFIVNGSQSVYPCIGSWSRCLHSAVSLFSAYHEGKYIHTRIMTNTMRNTEFTALEAIRERVSNVKDFLDTKKILNEVFIAYFLEHDFVEGFNSHRGDVTFLLILLNDLLDELLVESLQNPIQKPCNN